jgi:glycosyltransferase involved in cell wall biosynthesis
VIEPLVSIVIPTYNRANVIKETLDSVLAQTYAHWELLVIDDGSTDNTDTIIAQYRDSRIQYHRIGHCGMIGQVRNHGMKKARGGFIAFLDSDDLWRSDTLSCQLSLFKKFPQSGFVFSNGNEFGEFAVTPPDQEALFAGDVFLPIILEQRFSLFVSSWLVRREVFDKTGWIDESLKSGGDIDFFLSMAHEYPGVFTNERLVNHRKHIQGISMDLEVTAYEEHCRTMKKFLDRTWLTLHQYRTVVSDLNYKMGLVLLRKKDPARAMKAFRKFIAMKPLNYKGWVRAAQAAVGSVTG